MKLLIIWAWCWWQLVAHHKSKEEVTNMAFRKFILPRLTPGV